MAFADHYPLDAFAAVADAAWWRSNDFTRTKPGEQNDRAGYEKAHAADLADQKRIDAHKVVLKEAMNAHLIALRAEGRLGKTGGLEGRSVPIATAWNDFVDAKDLGYEFQWLMSAFVSVWTRCFVEMDKGRYQRAQEDAHVPGSHTPPTPEQVMAAWTEICRQFDEGNSLYPDRLFGWWEIEANDRNTGERCQLHFSDWKATLMKFDESYKLVPAEDVEELGIAVAEFAMPSGVMMLTDALRIEGFKDGTEFDADRDYGSLSLDNAKGRNNRVLAHAAEHQIGYTQTTNTSVAVWRDADGRILVTERWCEDLEGDDGEIRLDGWERVGDFSCDVWCVMAFDRESAIAQMTAGGCDNAAAELDRYLGMAGASVEQGDHRAHHEACYADNVVTLEVQPGTWRIHGGEKFSALVDRKAMRLPDDVEIWCLLESAA